jgi:2-iminobutanoate/2-iminopropanoate deaminase
MRKNMGRYRPRISLRPSGLRSLVVYVTDMDRYWPLVNKIQEEFWGGGPYPPRTIVEVSRLDQDDIVEVEGKFFCPTREVA